MCGIVGYLSAEPGPGKIPVVKKMADAISHRGMDGEGQWTNTNGHVAFGHRRLSIIDLSENGSQPMHYMDDRYTIVYNGEIYNYLELKALLIKSGYSFKSDCDTEVILAMYAFKGEECLGDLDGMFAFAIWDEEKQTLFCARDRFGEKPFYYYHIPGEAFYFASEMKALWAAGVPKIIDEERISLYLDWQFLDTTDLSRTFYKKIKQLDSGHSILVKDLNIIEQQKYYSLDKVVQNDKISINEAAQELYSMLENSVRLRLRSDVPVGSSLSGGIDSSTVVMMIDNLIGNSELQNSFSARFSGFKKDEGRYIKKVVEACKQINNHEVWPTGDQLAEEIDKVFYHQEEPFGSASIFAQWKVMELAKNKGVTVLLDGQGADEYLAGYLPYYKLYVNQLYYNKRDLYQSELNTYNTLRVDEPIHHHQTLRQRLGHARRKLMGRTAPFHENALKSQLRTDTTIDGLKVLLRYADRNSMAHSREVRLPFLDHKVVEFIFSLPDSFLLRDGWTKYILRKATSDLLPKEIAWRVDKVGFEAPDSDWLKKVITPTMQNRVDEYMGDVVNHRGASHRPLTEWNYLMISKLIN